MLATKIQAPDVQDVLDVHFVAWSDAALGNRPGGSTGGYIIAATGNTILEGKAARLNFVSWKFGRLARLARSSLSAEDQALSDFEEEDLTLVRDVWQ